MTAAVTVDLLGPLQVCAEGRPVPLGGPKQQLVLLRLLVSHPEPASADLLAEAVWGEEPYGVENAVTVHIRHLREKLEIVPSDPRYIKVVWGQGYKIEEGRPK